MTRPSCRGPMQARGFTLVEMMVTLVVFAIVVLALSTIVMNASRSKTLTTNNLESTEAARIASDMIARDLRAAGYGADIGSSPKQLPIAYVDSLEVIVNENQNPFPDSSVVRGFPLAYNPNANPKPFPLTGTAWQPPIRYMTGAECVRWTLDLDNNGAVGRSDVDAAPTRRGPETRTTTCWRGRCTAIRPVR
jgi:prepilin-type N-terminal cleavage/methylation domain-containing protein